MLSRYSGFVHRFSIHISNISNNIVYVCVVCARVKACFIQKHRVNDPIELLTLLSHINAFFFNFECIITIKKVWLTDTRKLRIDYIVFTGKGPKMGSGLKIGAGMKMALGLDGTINVLIQLLYGD